MISSAACGNFRITWKYVHSGETSNYLLSLKIDTLLSMFKSRRKFYQGHSALLRDTLGQAMNTPCFLLAGVLARLLQYIPVGDLF
jgi:hypothetical protein